MKPDINKCHVPGCSHYEEGTIECCETHERLYYPSVVTCAHCGHPTSGFFRVCAFASSVGGQNNDKFCDCAQHNREAQ